MLRQHSRRLALTVALSAVAGQAYAFGLGPIKIQSYIGQPLRAEIGVTQITPDETGSLKVQVASPGAFQAARLQYSDVLSGVQITLQHRADGTPYLLVVSNRPVREPFLDLLISAQWSNGQLSRDYTLLLDPAPKSSLTAATPQIPVQTAQPATAPSVAKRPVSAPAMPPAARPAPPPARQAGGTYEVHKGDTLSKIARETAVPTVSLEQMLTALYRNNTSAFINGNMNLLKAGAVLHLPTAEQAAGVSQAEARHFVIAQSRSFNAYRERLAKVVGEAKPEAAQAQRESGGKVQAKVEEPAAATAPGQSALKLSKAELKGASQAQMIADQKQLSADSAKIAQLQKNIEALKSAAKEAAAPAQHETSAGKAAVVAAASKAASALTVPVAAPVAPSAPQKAAEETPPAHAASTAPAAASAASQAAASAPAQHTASKPAPVAKPTPVKPKAEEGSFFSDLLANPLLLPVGGVVIVLLLLLALLAQRRKKAKAQRDVSVFDSRMSVADSFFGGTGGERVDTRNSSIGSTFSSSQIDTNDVDPVAEADVYLAYGRDLQAEEILKEAVKANPDRNAARLKLLEIYAKRKDSRSFEVGAAELFALTQGVGEDWQKAQELGRNLDPINPLYHNTVPPSTLGVPSTVPQTEFPAATPTALAALTPATLPSTEMMSHVQSEADAKALPEVLDLDLTLPLSSDEPATASPSIESREAEAPTTRSPVAGTPSQQPLPELPQVHAETPPVVQADPDFLSSGLDFSVPSQFGASRQSEAAPDLPDLHQTPAAPVASEAGGHSSPLEFDLSSIALDGESAAKPMEQVSSLLPAEDSSFADSQPLDTRFELAAESIAIGDLESARNLLEELKAEGDEGVRARAQEMLDKIGR